MTATDERVRCLQAVLPNIGPVTAATFVVASDEASGFRRAYLGPVFRELSSGETQRRGRITKAGSSLVRWLLIQAAVSTIDPRRRAFASS